MTLYADSARQANELWLKTLGKLFYDSDCILAPLDTSGWSSVGVELERDLTSVLRILMGKGF